MKVEIKIPKKVLFYIYYPGKVRFPPIYKGMLCIDIANYFLMKATF